jgi:DNA adenine methylase
MNTYQVVKTDVEALIRRLKDHQNCHRRTYYYAVRQWDRQEQQLSRVERAARMIYLNKTCYNGLYRVNRQGQFNVPMGRYRRPAILQTDTLRAASAALQHARLVTLDFREIGHIAQPGDFWYFDPPYHPISATASFTNYTAPSFKENDQRDLAAVYQRLSEKGCYCMLSNSYTPLIFKLYKHFRIETVQAIRAINSDVNGRGEIQEVMVLNY